MFEVGVKSLLTLQAFQVLSFLILFPCLFFALGVCGLCACVCFVSFLGQFFGLTSAVCGFGRIAQSCKHLTRFKMRLANLC